MAFQVPKNVMIGVKETLNLSDQDFEKAVHWFEKIPIDFEYDDTDSFFKDISKQLNIGSDKAEAILNTLEDLYKIREIAGIHADTYLEDLKDGIIYNRYSDVDIPNDKLETFDQRFEILLNLQNFRTISKAYRLQKDGERLYCTSKILSDIRPVFEQNPDSDPHSAVITHTLKLSYHQGNEHNELHIILDADDLNALANVVQRALSKDETLRRLLEKMTIKDLGV